jgi:ATP-dependent DNA ligase
MTNWKRWKGIMKCYPFEEKRLAKWKPPYIVQPKYDGIRCRAIPMENGEYVLLSSEENVIFSVPHINEELKKITTERRELDGELYSHEMTFEQITSITSRTVNIHPDHKEINFHIFDVVSDSPQTSRILYLNNIRDDSTRFSYIKFSPYWICDNLNEIMKVYDNLIQLDYEGIIVRHIAAPYERKRSLWVMKFKPKKEDIYEIKGYVEEKNIAGIPKGRLGALILDSGDNNHTFNVGTGFNNSDREYLWSIKETLPGNFVKVQYQHITSGNKVPRFPVFVEVVENEKTEEA